MTDALIYADLFLVTFVQALAWGSALGVVWLVGRAIDRDIGR